MDGVGLYLRQKHALTSRGRGIRTLGTSVAKELTQLLGRHFGPGGHSATGRRNEAARPRHCYGLKWGPMSSAPDPSSFPAALHELTTLSGGQRALLDFLVEKDHALGKIFVGAVMARAATGNPDHLEQASHSLRELIDKLPRHFDVVPVNEPGDMGNKVKNLASRWKKEPRVKNNSDEAISGSFLEDLRKFFEWVELNFPLRREVARRTVTKFDSTGRELPRPIEELHAKEWMEIRQFFINSAHHDPCSISNFDRWYNAFESFMLNRLRPRTFDNADKIDALIREGES